MKMAKYDILTALEIHKGIKFKTFVDVGSASGEYTSVFNKIFPDSKVYAFEPVPEYHKKPKGYNPIEIALWNKDGYTEFMVNNDPRGSRILKVKPYGSKLEANKNNIFKIKNVKTARFDNLDLEIKQPALLKIDVEGAEKEVLEGFGDRLREFDVIILEYNMIKNLMSTKILSYLDKMGYHSFIQKDLRAGYDQCNMFFIKDGGDSWGIWKLRGETPDSKY